MLDRGRIWRPLAAQTDPRWRRSFGDAARPLVPRYLRRGVVERLLADGSVLPAARRGAGAQPARGARALQRRGRRDLPAQRLRQRRARAPPARAGPRGARRRVPVSISSETSPLAKEYARASTTVIDVFMKLIFTGYAHELDAELRAPGFAGELNFADCAATLLPWARGAREAVSDRLRRARRRHDRRARGCGDAIGEANLICCDVGGTSTDISLVIDGQPFVNNTFELEHDLIINALSTEISSVGAGGGSIVSISAVRRRAGRPGQRRRRPRPGLLRPRRHAPTMTDACLLMGILDPDDFAGGEMRLDAERARRAFESLDTPPARRGAHRLRLPHRRDQHRRGGRERRDPPRRRPARLHADRLRRGRADAAAGGARADARARA